MGNCTIERESTCQSVYPWTKDLGGTERGGCNCLVLFFILLDRDFFFRTVEQG